MPINRLAYLLCCFFIFLSSFLFAQPPKLIVPVGHTGEVLSGSFSPDGKKILTVSADGTAKLWDTFTGTLLKDYKAGGDASSVAVTTASFSPSGKYVLINFENSELGIWETISGKLVWDWTGTPSDYYVPVMYAENHFSPDEKRIAMLHPYYADTISKRADPVIYDNESRQPILSLKGHKADVTSLYYSKDGKYIITASEDSTIKTWNASNGKMISTQKLKTNSIQILLPIPNSKTVMIIVNGIAKIFDIASAKQINLEMEKGINQDEIVYQTDNYGRYIAGLVQHYGTEDYLPGDKQNGYKKIIVWNAQTGKIIYKRSGLAEHENSILFSPDGKKIILINADSTISISDAATGRSLNTMKGFDNFIRTAAFSSDNKKIITTLYDKRIVVWDKVSGRLNPAISSNKEIVKAYFYEDENYIYDTATNERIVDLKSLQHFYKPLLSDNYDTIFAILRDRSASLWDAETGKLISPIGRREFVVDDASISNDGKFVLISSADNSAKLWDLNYKNVITEYKGRSIPVIKASFSTDNSRLFLLTAQGEKILNISNGKLITDSTEISNSKKLRFKNYSHISPDSSISLNWAADIINTIPNTEATMKYGGAMYGLLHNNRFDGILKSVLFSPDSRKLLITLNDNTTRLYDFEQDKFITTLILFDSSDYINQLPEGYYQVTPNAAKMLNYLTKDSKLISFEQLDVKYNRPDKVLIAMGNKDSSLISSYYNAYVKRIEKLGIDTMAFREDYDIPEADISNRDHIALEQKNDKLSVHIKGSDGKFLLDRFNLWINEVPLFGMKGVRIRNEKKYKVDTTINIILSEGENRIETSVTNINGIESYRKPLSVKYVPEKNTNAKVYFIGVGINDFADSTYNLKWCVQDIRDMVKTMRAKYGDQLVIIDTLYNEHATRTNISELKKKLFSTGVNDKVIFSYSGHGLLSKDFDYYLSSYTINFKDPEEGGIPYDEIENIFDSIPARKKILLLDACNSGEVDKEEMKKIETASGELAKNSTTVHNSSRGVIVTNTDTTTRIGFQNSFDLMQSLFVNVGKGTGAVIIAASGGVQFAQERSELGHGVFTYSVIEAMQNNPSMKVSELKKYIGDSVVKLTNGLQKPTTRNETIAVDWNVW